MSLVLSKDPNWPDTLCSTDVSGASVTLLGEDGCQVQVPAALLVAVSPLVKSMMADLLPPAYSPHVISIPAVTGDVLLLVAELLFKGTAVVQGNDGEVQEVFKMMGIEAFLSYCVSDREVKDEDSTEDSCQFEIHVKLEKSDEIKSIKVENKKIERNLFSERNKSSSDILVTPNENKDKQREKPFACDQCDYRAAYRGHLKQHMRIHSGEKPFACDQCPYRAALKENLKKHMLIHTGEKPFACDECAHRAVSKSRLKQHMLVHSRKKPVACDQCDYKGVRGGDLKRHIMVIHTGVKPFACDQCDYIGYKHLNLVRHKEYMHKPDLC